MAMTKREEDARNYLFHYLGKQGYKTYGKLLQQFHLNLTKDPNVLGYMEPKTGRIVVNSSLDVDQVALIVRHEILHFYLNHSKRVLAKLAKLKGLDPDHLEKASVEELEQEIYGDPEQTAN